MLGQGVRDVHARRVRRLAARARERRPGRAPPECRGRRRQLRLRGAPGLLRRRERAGRGDAGLLAAGHRPTTWPSRSGSFVGVPHQRGARIGAAPPDTGDEFELRCAPPPKRTSPWSSSAPTASGSPRDTTALICRSPAVSASSWRRSWRSTATVVVVNAGSRGHAVGGARRGRAHDMVPGRGGRGTPLADMLVGAAEPSRRLPVTFASDVEDGPAGLGVEGDRYPGCRGQGGVYGEGVLVGYRIFETAHMAPLFPFGFGLSYGDIVFDEVQADADGRDRHVGQQRAQGAAARSSRSKNGHRELGPSTRPRAGLGSRGRASTREGGETVRVDSGAPPPSATGTSTVPPAHDPGRYEVLVGAPSRDIRAAASSLWGGSTTP